MKYVRKIVWLLIGITFFVSLIIGIGIIFSVKNVNVSLESFRYSEWEEMTEAQRATAEEEISSFKNKVLGKYRGALMSFVDEQEIVACLNGTEYAVDSFTKEYPCTLNIKLKERREVFVVAATDGYRIYDEHGEFLRSGEDPLNSIDGAPNIDVSGADLSKINDIATLSGYFAESFSALRTIVKRIEIQTTETKNMVFYLRCGLRIWISDYANLSVEKIEAAYKQFISLSGEKKLSGSIHAGVSVNDGTVRALYFN